MPEEKEFQQRIQRIDALVRRLETTPDKGLWTAVQDLLQSVMDLHGMALDRILTIVAEQQGQAPPIEALSQDELVSCVLLLHGLHPIDLETRARRALEKTENILRGYGARAELLDIVDGNIRIRVRGVSSGHVAKSSRAAIEEAIYDSAPDAASVTILGLDQFGAADFVPLAQLQTAPASANGLLSASAGKVGF
jgi:hypothetical protein